jgi:hypothetical protein
LFKRAKAMREAGRHENLFAAISRQRLGEALQL